MKVNYTVIGELNLKEVKELLKPFGGRCAKVADGKLEYQIANENEKPAYEALKEKNYIE